MESSSPSQLARGLCSLHPSGNAHSKPTQIFFVKNPWPVRPQGSQAPFSWASKAGNPLICWVSYGSLQHLLFTVKVLQQWQMQLQPAQNSRIWSTKSFQILNVSAISLANEFLWSSHLVLSTRQEGLPTQFHGKLCSVAPWKATRIPGKFTTQLPWLLKGAANPPGEVRQHCGALGAHQSQF